MKNKPNNGKLIMINKNKEIGGTHYSDMPIEPIELIEVFNLDFIQGCIVKYISRYNKKNGIEDLEKALHYCKIGIKRFDRTENYIELNPRNSLIVKMYCMINGLSDFENMIIGYAISNNYEKCANEISNLILRKESV